MLGVAHVVSITADNVFPSSVGFGSKGASSVNNEVNAVISRMDCTGRLRSRSNLSFAPIKAAYGDEYAVMAVVDPTGLCGTSELKARLSIALRAI